MAYVYGHYKADTGELFYIGKGTGKRAWSRNRRNNHWENVVNKHGYDIKILIDNLSDEEAFVKEKELIAEVGLNNLVNMIDGGNGLTSEAAKQLTQRLSQDPEWRRKMTEKNKKQAQDSEWRRKVADSNKKQAQDPEWRRKQKEGAQKNTENVERNQKISEKVKSYWENNPTDDRNKKTAQDPEWRKKVTEKNKQMAQDPEWRRKQREGIRLYWENKRKLKQSES